MSSVATSSRPNSVGTALAHVQQESSQSAASSATVSFNLQATTPSVQLGKDADISTTKALKQSFIRTNPIYANSFGVQAFGRTTSYGLKLIGWRVIGRAQQRWQRLEPSLLSLLISRREVLYSKRPPGLIIDPPCALRCFLIGPDKEHATPHATVLCGMPWLRKAMGKLITKSGLLISDGFECCGLPDKPELYGHVVSKEDVSLGSQAAQEGELSEETEPRAPIVRVLEEYDMQYGSALDFRLEKTSQNAPATSVSESANGRWVEIFHNGTRVGSGTLGGIIVIDDRRFELTVRHVFRPPKRISERFSQLVLSDAQGVDDPDGLEIDLFDSDSESAHSSDTDETTGTETLKVRHRLRVTDSEENSTKEEEDFDLTLLDPPMAYSRQPGGTFPGGSIRTNREKAVAQTRATDDMGVESESSDSETCSIISAQLDEGRAPDVSTTPTSQHGTNTESVRPAIQPSTPFARTARQQEEPELVRLGRRTLARDRAALSALGVLVAPFTGGLSLGITAVGLAGLSMEAKKATQAAESQQKQPQESKMKTKAPGMESEISPSTDKPNPIFVPSNLKLDYALREAAPKGIFETRQEALQRSNVSFAKPYEFASPDQILIKTPTGLQAATTDSTGIMGSIPITHDLSIPPQRVQVVVLAENAYLYPGECGSWAMNREGEFTGMLIASCPSLREAYLLPMSDILEDIFEQTGLEAKVARTRPSSLLDSEFKPKS